MNKICVFSLLAASAVSTPLAFLQANDRVSVQGDRMNYDVICSDPKAEIRDFSYSLIIQSGGVLGLTTAKVFEREHAEPLKKVGTYIVTRSETNSEVTYEGKRFKLVIDLTQTVLATKSHPAKLEGTAQTGLQSIEAKLNCRIANERN